jgi:hypothetical protein
MWAGGSLPFFATPVSKMWKPILAIFLLDTAKASFAGAHCRFALPAQNRPYSRQLLFGGSLHPHPNQFVDLIRRVVCVNAQSAQSVAPHLRGKTARL